MTSIRMLLAGAMFFWRRNLWTSQRPKSCQCGRWWKLSRLTSDSYNWLEKWRSQGTSGELRTKSLNFQGWQLESCEEGGNGNRSSSSKLSDTIYQWFRAKGSSVVDLLGQNHKISELAGKLWFSSLKFTFYQWI